MHIKFAPQFTILLQEVPQVNGLYKFNSNLSELPTPELQSA